MQIVVLASEPQKEALLRGGAIDIDWITDIHGFAQYPSAGAYLDLLYVNETERNAALARLAPALVCINSVADTLPNTHPDFIRCNGWEGFLDSPLVEASCSDEARKPEAETVFAVLNKKLEWVPDEPGFVTARVISMIINEAYLALAEGVSSKEEMDTAMKLGTAYPYGPFEWSEKIGLKNVADLLEKLSRQHARYHPAPLLLQEAGNIT
jgi:3-hydroxybutyryl-CoA dehydrogenase